MTRLSSIGVLIIFMLTCTWSLMAQDKSSASQHVVFAVVRTTSTAFALQNVDPSYVKAPAEVKMTISIDGKAPQTHKRTKLAGLQAQVSKGNANEQRESFIRGTGRTLITLTD